MILFCYLLVNIILFSSYTTKFIIKEEYYKFYMYTPDSYKINIIDNSLHIKLKLGLNEPSIFSSKWVDFKLIFNIKDYNYVINNDDKGFSCEEKRNCFKLDKDLDYHYTFASVYNHQTGYFISESLPRFNYITNNTISENIFNTEFSTNYLIQLLNRKNNYIFWNLDLNFNKNGKNTSNNKVIFDLKNRVEVEIDYKKEIEIDLTKDLTIKTYTDIDLSFKNNIYFTLILHKNNDIASFYKIFCKNDMNCKHKDDLNNNIKGKITVKFNDKFDKEYLIKFNYNDLFQINKNNEIVFFFDIKKKEEGSNNNYNTFILNNLFFNKYYLNVNYFQVLDHNNNINITKKVGFHKKVSFFNLTNIILTIVFILLNSLLYLLYKKIN